MVKQIYRGQEYSFLFIANDAEITTNVWTVNAFGLTRHGHGSPFDHSGGGHVGACKVFDAVARQRAIFARAV